MDALHFVIANGELATKCRLCLKDGVADGRTLSCWRESRS
jgi:hypothetical protein